MIELPDVTLVCLDRREPALSLAAIEQSTLRCRFADAVLVTDRDLAIEGVRVIGGAGADASAARFTAGDLAGAVRSSHVLLIGWDAFVVNPEGWSNAFLEFDCVVPRRPAAAASADAHAATGIALLSRQFLACMSGVDLAGAEDAFAAIHGICAAESGTGLAYAPAGVARRFAFGAQPPTGAPFGFERLCNMWMYFQPRDLDAFSAMASPAALRTHDALSLAINLRELGRNAEAAALLRAIAGADPANERAAMLLESMPLVSASTKPAGSVGRNDPCPCGSGKRYKQCHGMLGVPAPAPPAASVPPAPPRASAPPAFEPSAVQRAATASGKPSQSASGASAVRLYRARLAFQRGDPAAETLYRNALDLDPDSAEATSYLGVIAMQQAHEDEAEALLRRAIDLAPHVPDYRTNLGALLQRRGDFAGAEDAYTSAIDVDPHHAPAQNNLGLLLQENGETEAAIASFRHAIAAVPAFADAHWNLALALLQAGRFDEGWAEQEWRFEAAQERDGWARRRWYPRWNGEPLAGKHLLVLAEQGAGDMIQFIRYAAVLAADGATIVVEGATPLRQLLRDTDGVAEVVPVGGPFPPCDFQIPLMSLPFAHATRLDSIPAPVGYLRANPARSARWRALLGARRKPRIGLNWSGNPEQVRNRSRAVPLAALEPLLARGDIEWFSLQKGAPAAELRALPPHRVVRDLMDHAQDFADTAALIMQLDLVISVDTGVVHLAGALGASTLTLLDAAPDCRWLLERDDSPWYPTMRLFRQASRGDWRPVIDEVAEEVSRRFPGTE